MPNWEQWLNTDEHKRITKKPDKNIFCRKNKQGNNQYGYHIYSDAENNNTCILCGHIREKQNNLVIKNKDNNEKRYNETTNI